MARVSSVIARIRELLQKNRIARYGLVILVVVVAGYLIAGRLFGGRSAPQPATRLPAPAPSATPAPPAAPAAPAVITGGRTDIGPPGEKTGGLRVLRIASTRRTVTFLQAGRRFGVALGGESDDMVPRTSRPRVLLLLPLGAPLAVPTVVTAP